MDFTDEFVEEEGIDETGADKKGTRKNHSEMPPIYNTLERVRVYRAEEEGVLGKQCPTCKIFVTEKRFNGHVKYCYFCRKCNLFKTNKIKHDPKCDNLPISKTGRPCPYCNGRLVAHLLRHLQTTHNLTPEECAVFRKNALSKDTPLESRQQVRYRFTHAKNKVLDHNLPFLTIYYRHKSMYKNLHKNIANLWPVNALFDYFLATFAVVYI